MACLYRLSLVWVFKMFRAPVYILIYVRVVESTFSGALFRAAASDNTAKHPCKEQREKAKEGGAGHLQFAFRFTQVFWL